MNNTLGITLGFTAVAGWAAYSIAGAAALRSGFSPSELAALRYVVPGILLAPFLLTGMAGRLRKIGLARMLCLGLLAGPLYGYAVMAGLTLAPLSHAVVLGPLGVLLSTMLISLSETGAWPSRPEVIGGIMVMSGVAMVAGPTFDGGSLAMILLGDFVFFTTGIAMGLFGILSRRWQIAPLDTLAAVAFTSTAALLPFLPAIFGQPMARHGFGPFAVQALMQGVIGGLLALLAYVHAIKLLGSLSFLRHG
jgi:drug/metabolite transporter (DMT)-like permease